MFDESEIAKYYSGKSIFITGGTGFLGKVLIEKLLRSCPNIKTLYVLIRSKKGKVPRERLREIFDCSLYDRLRQEQPNFNEKVIPIVGDIEESNLGITQEDEMQLIQDVNIIIHSAATVRFDEPLKLAVEINMNGVKKVIRLARLVKNLEVLVHVSTAYANCNRENIDESVYPPTVPPESLMESLKWMDNELIQHMTPKLVKNHPNTYTFTKHLAETIVKEASNDIPVVIVRPSIVVSSMQEPTPGWIDNTFGPTGLVIATGKGYLRSMIGQTDLVIDLIPVDLSCNLIISAGWYRGSERIQETQVFNGVSGRTNPLKWGFFEKYLIESFNKNPFEKIRGVSQKVFTRSRVANYAVVFFQQILLAHVLDFFLRITKQNPHNVKMQKRLEKNLEVVNYFAQHEWKFNDENVIQLKNTQNSHDRRLFNIDVSTINWQSYIDTYCYGTKKFVLKEDATKEITKSRQQINNTSYDKNNFIFGFNRHQKVVKFSLFLVLFPVCFFIEYSNNLLAFIITISTILLKTF